MLESDAEGRSGVVMRLVVSNDGGGGGWRLRDRLLV